jgi:molecular chaperone DnaK (HSP70)
MAKVMSSRALGFLERAILERPEHKPASPFRVIGTDLGTTNSTVCEIRWPAGQALPEPPRCLNIEQPTMQGIYTHVLVPSVVALHEDKLWVGEGAKRLRALPGMGVQEYRSWFAETKNDMGIQRTYHRAPTGLRSARAVATELLKFLYAAALRESEEPIERVVVTVPASFQAAQRWDTVCAAQRAQIPLSEGDLLDEPIAAFLAYLAEAGEAFDAWLEPAAAPKNLLVFDFGGGTCDVAVFRLFAKDGGLSAAPVTVSRYHRLGGGDIDRAIIHEVLLAQLLEQNQLERFSLDYEDKRLRVQPALLAVAEALKQKLSNQIWRLKKLGRWERTDPSQLVEVLPGVYEIALRDRVVALRSPHLSAEEFERVLAPFLDRDLLFPREDDYRITCSIFAPIQDALDRGRLDREEIDLCLLAGGSSLIPQMAEAIDRYFPNARTLSFEDRDAVQTAVAVGAALHALSRRVLGRPLIQPTCHDDILFHTRQGPIVLVPAGAPLPYPQEGDYARNTDLTVPETVKAGAAGNIRVEVLAGREERLLFRGNWKIPGPINRGDPLWLEFRFDADQVLHLRLGRQGDEEVFEQTIENPLTHVVNPNETRARIMDLEEALRTRSFEPAEMAGKFEELGDLCRRVNQREKALAYYGRAVRLAGETPTALLNKMAFCASEMGDRKRAEQFFSEAARRDPWPGSYFNWAFAKEQWGEPDRALELVDKALALEAEPAYQALKARLVQKLGDADRGRELAAAALRQFPPPETLSQFELFWLKVAARIAGDARRAEEAEKWIRARAAESRRGASFIEGELPERRLRDEEELE